MSNTTESATTVSASGEGAGNGAAHALPLPRPSALLHVLAPLQRQLAVRHKRSQEFTVEARQGATS